MTKIGKEMQGKNYSNIDAQLAALADIIIDCFLVKRSKRGAKSSIMEMSSDTVRFFNGRLGQS